MPSCTRSRSLEIGNRHRKTNFLLQSASFSLGFIFILYASIMFWNTFILQPQITNMKTNLYTLKETVNSIGVAYDNLSKDIKFLNGGINEAEVNDIPINDDIELIPSNESKMGYENYDRIKKVDKKTQKSLSRLNSIDARTASKSNKNKRRDSFKPSNTKLKSLNTKPKSSNTKLKSSNTKIKTVSQYSRNSRNKYPKHKTIDESFETSFVDSKHNMHTSAHMNVSHQNKRNQSSYCNTMGNVQETGTLTENTAPERTMSKNSQFVNFKEAIGLQSTDPFWNDIEFWFKEHQQKNKKQHICCKSEPKPDHKYGHKASCRQGDKRRFTIPSMTP